MQVETAHTLLRAAHDLGMDGRLREAYSGTGMYGRTTTGITLPAAVSLAIMTAHAVLTLMESGHEDAADRCDLLLKEFRRFRMDNLNHEVVVY